jgi:hypothetical protein
MSSEWIQRASAAVIFASALSAIGCGSSEGGPTSAASSGTPSAKPTAPTAASNVTADAAPSLKAGDAAPAWSLPGSDGKTHALADHVGKQAVVVAWFPKAFTGG